MCTYIYTYHKYVYICMYIYIYKLISTKRLSMTCQKTYKSSLHNPGHGFCDGKSVKHQQVDAKEVPSGKLTSSSY